MYQIIFHSPDSEQTLSLAPNTPLQIGYSESHDLYLQEEGKEHLALTLEALPEGVKVSPAKGELIMCSGKALTQEELIAAPVDISIGESYTLTISPSFDPLSDDSISSLIQELESTTHNDVDIIKSEVAKASDDTTNLLDGLEEIFATEKDSVSNESETSENFNVSDLIEEASNAFSEEVPVSEAEPFQEEALIEEPQEIKIEFAEECEEIEEEAPIAEANSLEKQTLPIEKEEGEENLPSTPPPISHSPENKIRKEKPYPRLLIVLLLLIVGLGAALVHQHEKKKIEYTKYALCDLAMLYFHQSLQNNETKHLDSINKDQAKELIKGLIPPALYPFYGAFGKERFLNSLGYDFSVERSPEEVILKATPKTSLLNTLFPKNSFFVSTKEMLLKKKDSLVAFNQEQMAHKRGFYIPEDFKKIFPESPEFIYAFPRYYPMSEQGFKYLSEIANGEASPLKMVSILNYLKGLQQIPSFVFYSPRGSLDLNLLQHELLPHGPFFGSLAFGYVTLSSPLFLIENVSILAPQHKFNAQDRESQKQQSLQEEIAKALDAFETGITPYMAELGKLIDHPDTPLIQDYIKLFEEASQNFLNERTQLEEILMKRLEALHEEWVGQNKISKEAFLQSLSEFNIPLLIKESLPQRDHSSSIKNIDLLLEEIKASKSPSEALPLAQQISKNISPEIFSSPIEYQKYQALFRDTLFNQTEVYLKQTSQATEARSIFLNNLGKLFSLAGVSSEEQEIFFETLFDELDKLHLTSNQNQKIKNIERDLATGFTPPNALPQSPETIKQIPLDASRSSSSRDEDRDIARLGKQLLINLTTEPPSLKRSEELLDAISLISRGTLSNRSDWGDILEARAMILEYPSSELYTLLKSELGLSTEASNSFMKLKSAFERYQDIKEEIVSKISSDQSIPFESFASSLSSSLKALNTQVDKINAQVLQLGKFLDLYNENLKSFLEGYKTAREEGFFAQERSYHEDQLKALEEKSEGALKLKTKFTEAQRKIMSLLGFYKKFISEELSKIKSRHIYTAKKPSKSPEIFYGVSLGEELKNNLSIAVQPTP